MRITGKHRELLRSLTSFTQKEKYGIGVLLLLLVVLLIINASIKYIIEPHQSSTFEDSLRLRWKQILRESDSVRYVQYLADSVDNAQPVSINKADSAHLAKLKGLSPKKIEAIMAMRQKGHYFHHLFEVEEFLGIKYEDWLQVKNRIIIE